MITAEMMNRCDEAARRIAESVAAGMTAENADDVMAGWFRIFDEHGLTTDDLRMVAFLRTAEHLKAMLERTLAEGSIQ